MLQVDPALFTPDYDAALAQGLLDNGVDSAWAIRPLRDGEVSALPASQSFALFYRGLQDSVRGRGVAAKLRKGLSHLSGLQAVAGLMETGRYDLLHMQWLVMPLADAWLMRRVARRFPVILTVHDSSPFNGSPTSRLQIMGFEGALSAADRLVVHTRSARDTLLARGMPARKIAVIAHGPLRLASPLEEDDMAASQDARPGGRRGESLSLAGKWHIVLFGKLQPYKGVDLLIDAVARIPPALRERLRVTIAGEALMPLQPLIDQIAALGLGEQITLVPKRFSEAEMARLFAAADAFVFPYRHIEASGVLFLVQPLKKWIIASDLGSFAETLVEGRTGTLVQPGAADGLAVALAASIGRTPDPAYLSKTPGWREIGARNRELYLELLATRPTR